MRYSIYSVIAVLILLIGCESLGDDYIMLDAGVEFTFNLNVSGDEEGAIIIQQAKHYSRSEIVRDSSTGWSAVYFYIPAKGYTGPDYVTIETCTGGSGIQCDQIDTIEFRFQIVH